MLEDHHSSQDGIAISTDLTPSKALIQRIFRAVFVRHTAKPLRPEQTHSH